jgi:hypothetical protein
MNQTGEETTVQDSQARPRKLTLARETLRTLGDATLARAAGGTFEPWQPWQTGFGSEPQVDETSASGI